MFTLREKSTLKKYKKVMKVLKYKGKMKIYNITPNTPFVQSCKPNIKSWLNSLITEILIEKEKKKNINQQLI